jgi:hypothetical protein
MIPMTVRSTICAIACVTMLPSILAAQDAGTAREAARARRDARREAIGDQPPTTRGALAERERLEGALRVALARAVRERLSLSDQQATRLMDVNRRFGEDRLRLTREELRIRRDLRQAIATGDSARSPETGRLLDGLLDVQRQRLELQQKEQTELSEFLTPEQRARYIGMMEQLRRRIQARADSGRGNDE